MCYVVFNCGIVQKKNYNVHFTCEAHLACFQVKAMTNNRAMNIVCRTFGSHTYIFLLGTFLEVELLCHRGVCSALANTDSFPKWLYHVNPISRSSSALSIVGLLYSFLWVTSGISMQFQLVFPWWLMRLSTFSSVYCPFVYPLLLSVQINLLPVFLKGLPFLTDL